MFDLAEDNIVWWRMDMPGRNQDGELDSAPVRLQLRIYTRAELRERQKQRRQASVNPLTESLSKMLSAKDADALREATAEVTRKADALDDEADTLEADVFDRLVGWRADDLGGLEFSPELRDRLLADDLRFNAVRVALDEASRGVRAKNSLPGPAGKVAAAQAGKTEPNNSGTRKADSPA